MRMCCNSASQTEPHVSSLSLSHGDLCSQDHFVAVELCPSHMQQLRRKLLDNHHGGPKPGLAATYLASCSLKPGHTISINPPAMMLKAPAVPSCEFECLPFIVSTPWLDNLAFELLICDSKLAPDRLQAVPAGQTPCLTALKTRRSAYPAVKPSHRPAKYNLSTPR